MSANYYSILLFLLAAATQLPHLHGQRYDYRTANLSTVWTNGPNIVHTIDYQEGSLIKALLLHSPIEHYGPTFACGFYCRSNVGTPCRDFHFAVFIIYTNSGAGITFATLGVPQVVWSANRDRPVKENATLHFTPDGNLVLKDADGTLVWSTNTAGKQVATMTIADTGNLVLLDKRGAVVWQSFDHPTDVLVPGQKLFDGQSLASNASRWDPREGLYHLTASSTTFNAYVKAGPRQNYYYYGNPENGKRTRNYMQFINGSLDFFQGSSSTPTTSFALPATSSAQYMRLEFDGHLRVYQWFNSGGWKAVADVMEFYPPPGDCSYPTVCGSYGICSGNRQCSCPRDVNNRVVNYFLPVKDRQPELGCEPVIPVTCRDMKYHRLLQLDDININYRDESFKMPNVKSIRSCKEACLRRCSCKAAFYTYGSDESSGICYLVPLVLSLMDHNPEVMHYNSTGFIKVQVQ